MAQTVQRQRIGKTLQRPAVPAPNTTTGSTSSSTFTTRVTTTSTCGNAYSSLQKRALYRRHSESSSSTFSTGPSSAKRVRNASQEQDGPLPRGGTLQTTPDPLPDWILEKERKRHSSQDRLAIQREAIRQKIYVRDHDLGYEPRTRNRHEHQAQRQREMDMYMCGVKPEEENPYAYLLD